MIRRLPQYVFHWTENPVSQVDSSDRGALLQDLLEQMGTVELEYKDLDNTVFADGDPHSPVMMIGEGPGEHEVLQKLPFVGRSGKLLTEMLSAAGILRDRIYTTNTVIWRPPGNRAPMPDEIHLMRPYLLRHLEIIQPKFLLLVGGIAYRAVMNEITPISKIRGVIQSRDFCPKIMCIFHPSYLLRSPTHRKETWSDILRFRTEIQNQYTDLVTKGLLHL